jgi:hypothetical protein
VSGPLAIVACASGQRRDASGLGGACCAVVAGEFALSRQTVGVAEERLPYRFDQLGWLQFERLCVELLNLFCGVTSAEWHAVPMGRFLLRPEGVAVPGGERPFRAAQMRRARERNFKRAPPHSRTNLSRKGDGHRDVASVEGEQQCAFQAGQPLASCRQRAQQ